ncbi:lef-3 [Fopius arisanus]|nr:lef-3 [Fopius arisanus]
MNTQPIPPTLVQSRAVGAEAVTPISSLQRFVASRTNKPQISNKRKLRSTDIGQMFIPLRAKSKKLDSLIFHKHMEGFVMISLNEKHEPLRAWTNQKAFMPIRCTFVNDVSQFRSLLVTLKPRIIHLNDGEPLAPLAGYNISLYSNISLSDKLSLLRKQQNETNQPVGIKTKIPSYKSIKSLDPSITFADYKYIYNI